MGWPSCTFVRPDLGCAQRFALRRASGDHGDRNPTHVGRRAGCYGFRFLHVYGGDRHPNAHSTRRGPQHARTRHGPVRLDFPRRARNRRARSRVGVGAFRAAMDGFLRRHAGHRCLPLDVQQSRANNRRAAEPGLRSHCMKNEGAVGGRFVSRRCPFGCSQRCRPQDGCKPSLYSLAGHVASPTS
jgi:hypothetical protein